MKTCVHCQHDTVISNHEITKEEVGNVPLSVEHYDVHYKANHKAAAGVV